MIKIGAAQTSALLTRLTLTILLVAVAACVRETVTGSVTPAAVTGPPVKSTPVENRDEQKPAAQNKVFSIALVRAPGADERIAALTDAMAQMLSANGFEVVPPPSHMFPQDNLYFVSQVIDTKFEAGGEQQIAVSWIVTDASGEPIGKVAQRRQFDSNRNGEQWNRLATLAAAAAAEGVSRIIREQLEL